MPPPPDPTLARAWIDLGPAGWADVQAAMGELGRLGYSTEKVKRGEQTLLRVAGARLDTSELWVMPPP